MAICVSVIASSRKPSVIAVCIAGAPAEDPEMVSWWANYYHYFPSDLTITHGKLSRGLSGHKRAHLQAVCRLESLPFLCADKMGREIVSTCLCWCGVGWVLIKGIFFFHIIMLMTVIKVGGWGSPRLAAFATLCSTSFPLLIPTHTHTCNLLCCKYITQTLQLSFSIFSQEFIYWCTSILSYLLSAL